MIPDGTPAAEVVIVVIVVTLIAVILIAALFYFTRPRKEEPPVMSRAAQPSPAPAREQTEQRSDAVEPGTEPSGTEDGNAVPDIVERLEALDDDTLLDILALLRDGEGEYRFAESRVAKFIPGRVEDRLTQVRETRGTEKPAPPGRVLRVRDNAGERVIPFAEGRKVKG